MRYGEGLGKGMESTAPRDLPRSNVGDNEANLKKKLVSFGKTDGCNKVVNQEGLAGDGRFA